IVGKGMAINSVGQTLLLYDNIDVQLVSTPTNGSSTPGQGTFSAAQPSSTGQYGLGEGVYLLTLAPTKSNAGFSPVSALSLSGTTSSAATCNTRYLVDAVQFRLIQLTASSSLLRDPAHLRSRIAYRCFGFADDSPLSDTFGPFARNVRLLEALQQNTAQNG